MEERRAADERGREEAASRSGKRRRRGELQMREEAASRSGDWRRGAAEELEERWNRGELQMERKLPHAVEIGGELQMREDRKLHHAVEIGGEQQRSWRRDGEESCR